MDLLKSRIDRELSGAILVVFAGLLLMSGLNMLSKHIVSRELDIIAGILAFIIGFQLIFPYTKKAKSPAKKEEKQDSHIEPAHGEEHANADDHGKHDEHSHDDKHENESKDEHAHEEHAEPLDEGHGDEHGHEDSHEEKGDKPKAGHKKKKGKKAMGKEEKSGEKAHIIRD